MASGSACSYQGLDRVVGWESVVFGKKTEAGQVGRVGELDGEDVGVFLDCVVVPFRSWVAVDGVSRGKCDLMAFGVSEGRVC